MIALFLFFSFWTLSRPALADEPLALKISPTLFQLTVQPGISQEVKANLTNPNSFPITLLAESEYFLKADEEGNPQFLPPDTPGLLTNWLDFSFSDSFLAPGETKEIPLTVHLPQNTPAGGYYGSVFFTGQPVLEEKAQLGLQARVGALVVVAVSGEVSKTGEIVDFQVPSFFNRGPVNFQVEFQNTGNLHFQPQGTIAIYDSSAKQKALLDLPQHLILPQSGRQFITTWNVGRKLGKFRAVAQMTDGEGRISTKTKEFIIFPWQEIGLAFGWLLVLGWLGKIFFKKFSKKR